MGDYFRSWKRKLGVVTLLMACAFALECAGRTQSDWDRICPADWEYARMYAIAPLGVLSVYLLLSKPRAKADRATESVG